MVTEAAGIPGVVISALRGGSGKTLLSIGIAAACRLSGQIIAPFKKGPDYIDAGWLALAADRPCHNLDLFLTTPAYVQSSYLRHAASAHMAVVEGNRGLFDGIDMEGSTSTAEIAKLLGLPVILCIDATKLSRTAAAIVNGCLHFDPGLSIGGVILNRVAAARHESILRRSIEHHCAIPVIGALPKLRQQDFPERHMGLLPTQEHAWAQAAVTQAAELARQYIDLNSLRKIAAKAQKIMPLPGSGPCLQAGHTSAESSPTQRPVIGVIRDSAFQFYYPDNLAALAEAGADILFVSPLTQKALPPVDALYIGGGFPETHAQALAENRGFGEDIKTGAQAGLPIYAECGGLMYLGEKLVVENHSFEMTGVLPIVFGLARKPQGHGYTVSRVDRPNPYFTVGTEIRGHEFRYSKVLEWRGLDQDMVFATQRGTGFHNHRDGICYKNVLAAYTHLHALGTPEWAGALVRNALAFRNSRK